MTPDEISEREDIRKVWRNLSIFVGTVITLALIAALIGLVYEINQPEINQPELEWESPELMLLIKYTDDGTRTACLWAEQGDRGGLSCPAWLQEEPSWRQDE